MMGLSESFDLKKKLKIGSKGSEVAKLQKVLGIYVDGIFGPQTDECVKIFQRHKPDEIEDDGIVGHETIQKINKLESNLINWDSPPFCKSKSNRNKFEIDKVEQKLISGTNIIIGDSQTPYVAMNSSKAKLISKKPGPSSLWEGGKTVSWLIDAVSNYPKTPNISNVVIVIGTNGGFGKFTNDNIPKLFSVLREKFPNAKFHVVQGSWGWGGLKKISRNHVDRYYNKFRKEGANVIEPPIGEIEPHGNRPVYKTIGAALDSML